jgi:hypothetical protein
LIANILHSVAIKISRTGGGGAGGDQSTSGNECGTHIHKWYSCCIVHDGPLLALVLKYRSEHKVTDKA